VRDRELGRAGGPQARGADRPCQRVARQGPHADLGAVRPALRDHSTAVVTPELLAALAQTESSGDPVALTYWRWRFSANPFDIYRPASSAVGMFQITDGTFAEARRYCIHDHVVVEDGPWNDSAPAGSTRSTHVWCRRTPWR
jgi:hypothetical protein